MGGGGLYCTTLPKGGQGTLCHHWGARKATCHTTLPQGGQGTWGKQLPHDSTMTFSGCEARCRGEQEARDSAQKTKPHVITPPTGLKAYLCTNTRMLCVHHMPL